MHKQWYAKSGFALLAIAIGIVGLARWFGRRRPAAVYPIQALIVGCAWFFLLE